MTYLWERRVAMGIELLLQTGLGVGEECGPSFLYLLQKLDISATFVLWIEP